MFVRAAVNASHDLDPAQSATVVRVCFELSEVSGTRDEGRCEERSGVGPAGAGFGPIVRQRRGSDWAAYLTRDGQTARLEAWRSGGNEEEDQEMVREGSGDERGLDE